MKIERIGRTAGFTIVELMIVIMVLVVLVSIAVPSFRTWLRNAQVKNAASSITAGLQRARAEAVSRNASVSFTLSGDTSWTIDVVSPATRIETRQVTEGSQGVAVTPTGPVVITFNNMGVVVGGVARQFDFSASGSNKPLRVIVGVGGSAKMCDPSGYGLSAC